MTKIPLKPFSVNEAWKGRRFRTHEYKQFETDLLRLLPRDLEIPKNPYLIIKWGFSNMGSDWDNPIKPFQDVLQKGYGFNDSIVRNALVFKTKTRKEEEFIEFDVKTKDDWECCMIDYIKCNMGQPFNPVAFDQLRDAIEHKGSI